MFFNSILSHHRRNFTAAPGTYSKSFKLIEDNGGGYAATLTYNKTTHILYANKGNTVILFCLDCPITPNTPDFSMKVLPSPRCRIYSGSSALAGSLNYPYYPPFPTAMTWLDLLVYPSQGFFTVGGIQVPLNFIAGVTTIGFFIQDNSLSLDVSSPSFNAVFP